MISSSDTQGLLVKVARVEVPAVAADVPVDQVQVVRDLAGQGDHQAVARVNEANAHVAPNNVE